MGIQSASVILMIRPVAPARFSYNPETTDNKFTGVSEAAEQRCAYLRMMLEELTPEILPEEAEMLKNLIRKDEKSLEISEREALGILVERASKIVHEKAMKEFDAVKKMYEDAGIVVVELQNPDDVAVDSIFPNSVVTHAARKKGGRDTMTLHPMKMPSRRREHNKFFRHFMTNIAGYKMLHDYTAYENQNRAFEATAAMVHVEDLPASYLNKHRAEYKKKFGEDGVYKSAFFSGRSERTDDALVEKYAQDMKFRPIIFNTRDKNGKPVYHTDVVINVGRKFSMICADAIPDETERKHVLNELRDMGKKVIKISLDQMANNFCGNAKEVVDQDGNISLAMSSGAYYSLTDEQKSDIGSCDVKIIHADVSTIQKHGGGSVRCLTQELFARDVPSFVERLKSYSSNLVFRMDDTIKNLRPSMVPEPQSELTFV